MYLTDSWYWDQTPGIARLGQALLRQDEEACRPACRPADYSAAYQYLTAVKATGTDNADKVMAKMKTTKINDMYVKDGYHPSGRPHDPRHVPDAGEDAGGIEDAVGLLKWQQTDPGRAGFHHQGRVEVRALEVTARNRNAELSAARVSNACRAFSSPVSLSTA